MTNELGGETAIYDRESLKRLAAQKKKYYLALSDPLLPNKAQTIQNVAKVNEILLKNKVLPYFCDQCHYTHRKGKIYASHIEHARILLEFPEITLPPLKLQFAGHVVQLEEYRSEPIFRYMQPYQSLELGIDRSSRAELVIVRIFDEIQNKLVNIGVLDTSKQKLLATIQALDNNYRAQCHFKAFFPRRTRVYKREIKSPYYADHVARFQEYWDVEHAKVDIEILNLADFMQVYTGLIEYLHLGHTQVIPALVKLGPEIIPFLEESAKSDPSIFKILDTIYNHFKIAIPSKFSIVR